MRNEDAMKTKLSFSIIAAAATIALTIPTSAHAVTTPPPSPTDDASTVIVEKVQIMPETDAESKSASSAQAICEAYGIVDYPHISTSNPSSARATQAHGGWNQGNCSATHADVTTQLDRMNPIGLYQAVGTQGRAVLPSQADMGLPSSNRVTARYECNGTAAASFRAWTSFDMVGIADTHTPTYSPGTDITCG